MDANKISFLNNNFKNAFSLKEYNNYSNICVYVKNIDLKFIKSVYDDFIEYMKYIVNKCGRESGKRPKKSSLNEQLELDVESRRFCRQLCRKSDFEIPIT